MAAHKYIKRTGSPGNYKYWYKMPDGNQKAAGDGGPKSHKQAQSEHILRLAIAKRKGLHNMSHQEIADLVGIKGSEHGVGSTPSRQKVNAALQRARRIKEQGEHGFEDHHAHESHHSDVESDAYRTKVQAIKDAIASRGGEPAPAPARKKKASKKVSKKKKKTSRSSSTDGLVAIERENLPERIRDAADTINAIGPSSFDAPYQDRERYREAQRIMDESPYTMRLGTVYGDPSTSALAERSAKKKTKKKASKKKKVSKKAASKKLTMPSGYNAERWSALSTEEKKEAIKVDKELKDAGINLAEVVATPTAEPVVEESRSAASSAIESVKRRNREIDPGSSAAVDLHAADPELEAADEPVARMVEAEASGENPYLSRAKEIYNRIKSDLNPERAEKVKHMLSTIESLRSEGKELSHDNMLTRYNEVRVLDGKRTVRQLPAGKTKPNGEIENGDFERGTFIGIGHYDREKNFVPGELITNKPVDIEVERMKRGFAAKQFARLKPYLNEAFTNAHPDAPPPYPTLQNLKTWGEFGTPREEHINTSNGHRVQKAMPQEFYDSITKGPDGKPTMPPAWMPLNLAPAWNYVVKKSAGNVYSESKGAIGNPSTLPQELGSVSQQSKLQLANQAAAQEGVLMTSLRKYVQMRGGPEQLVDIPSGKLTELDMTHAEIFKSDSDASLKKLITMKIIDPVALKPFIDAEMKQGVKKSFTLVVDADHAPVNFKKSYVVDSKKSEIIDKIKKLKKSYHART